MFIASDQKEDYISKQRVNIKCASMCSDVSYSLCHMLVSALCCGIFWPYLLPCHWTIIDAGHTHTKADVVNSVADPERVQSVRLNPLPVRFEIPLLYVLASLGGATTCLFPIGIAYYIPVQTRGPSFIVISLKPSFIFKNSIDTTGRSSFDVRVPMSNLKHLKYICNRQNRKLKTQNCDLSQPISSV